jgi:hypothetical protein
MIVIENPPTIIPINEYRQRKPITMNDVLTTLKPITTTPSPYPDIYVNDLALCVAHWRTENQIIPPPQLRKMLKEDPNPDFIKIFTLGFQKWKTITSPVNILTGFEYLYDYYSRCFVKVFTLTGLYAGGKSFSKDTYLSTRKTVALLFHEERWYLINDLQTFQTIIKCWCGYNVEKNYKNGGNGNFNNPKH